MTQYESLALAQSFVFHPSTGTPTPLEWEDTQIPKGSSRTHFNESEVNATEANESEANESEANKLEANESETRGRGAHIGDGSKQAGGGEKEPLAGEDEIMRFR